jgi:uncharacterized protein YndB with AHSA1/START domain
MSTVTGKTSYSHPSEEELQAVRTFDAPAALVFDAFTNPKHIPHWMLGPDGWTMPVCEHDLRVGGSYKNVWRSTEDGSEFFFSGTYQEIDAPTRLVHTEMFNGEPPAAVITSEFAEVGGRTTMTMTMRFPSKDVKESVLATGMTDGADTSYDRLDEFLRTAA